jgi:hypothetical protein
MLKQHFYFSDQLFVLNFPTFPTFLAALSSWIEGRYEVFPQQQYINE